jgi:hypothetical protein
MLIVEFVVLGKSSRLTNITSLLIECVRTKEEARSELELDLKTLTSTLDLEDKEIKIYYLLTDIISKAFLSI